MPYSEAGAHTIGLVINVAAARGPDADPGPHRVAARPSRPRWPAAACPQRGRRRERSALPGRGRLRAGARAARSGPAVSVGPVHRGDRRPGQSARDEPGPGGERRSEPDPACRSGRVVAGSLRRAVRRSGGSLRRPLRRGRGPRRQVPDRPRPQQRGLPGRRGAHPPGVRTLSAAGRSTSTPTSSWSAPRRCSRTRACTAGSRTWSGCGPGRAPVVDAGLTPTEREIVALVLQRRTNAEIARRALHVQAHHRAPPHPRLPEGGGRSEVAADRARQRTGAGRSADRSLSPSRRTRGRVRVGDAGSMPPRVAMPASTKRPAIAPTTVTAVDAPVWDRTPSVPLSSPLLFHPGRSHQRRPRPRGRRGWPRGAGLPVGLALGEGESLGSVGVGEGLGAARLVILTTGISASPPTGTVADLAFASPYASLIRPAPSVSHTAQVARAGRACGSPLSRPPG